jgi:hypothetical protein
VRFSHLAEDEIVANELLAKRRESWWIGLRRDSTDSDFTWLGGERWPRNMKEWWDGQQKPAFCCASVTWGPHVTPSGFVKKTRWPVQDCGERRGFLCEREPWHVHPSTGHAYRLFEEPVTQEAAARVCAAAGAHLATLTSADEHQFVIASTHTEVWLGATSPTGDGRFQWSTGEPFRFQAFAPGEPDDRAGCVALDNDDLWHDRSCTRKPYGALCEID